MGSPLVLAASRVGQASPTFRCPSVLTRFAAVALFAEQRWATRPSGCRSCSLAVLVGTRLAALLLLVVMWQSCFPETVCLGLGKQDCLRLDFAVMTAAVTIRC